MLDPVVDGANFFLTILYALPLPFRALIFAGFGFFVIACLVWWFKT